MCIRDSTWNDITDAKLDAKVLRTQNRPIPAGHVSKFQAFLWLILQCSLALGILITFNQLAIILGFLSVITIIIYPFAKRFTYWPQFFLGISFNWGIILAYAANSGTLDYFCIGLYISAIAWTIFYDTIYSFQDIKDDKEVGIKSTGILFEASPKQYLSIFLLICIITKIKLRPVFKGGNIKSRTFSAHSRLKIVQCKDFHACFIIASSNTRCFVLDFRWQFLSSVSLHCCMY